MFEAWKSGDDSDKSLIWVRGGMTTGKTELAYFMSHYLERYYSDQSDHWVLYYFCSSDHNSRKSAASILKGLIQMLCKKETALIKILYDEWYSSGDLLMQNHHIAKLWEIFEDMVNTSQAKLVYCIIDGIDKCEGNDKLEDDNLQHLLRKVNGVFRRQNKTRTSTMTEHFRRTLFRSPTDSLSAVSTANKLRMIVTTREMPEDIMKELHPFPRLSTDTEMDGLIETKLQRASTRFSTNQEPSEEAIGLIRKIYNSGRDQSFLFLGLLSEKVEGMTLSQLKKYVDHAPKTVEEFHCQTLLDIPPRQRPAVNAILKWVALAERPLTTLQLTKAVKYSLKKSFKRKTLAKLLTMCPGLLTEDSHRVVLGKAVLELLFSEQSPLLDFKQLREFVSERSDVHSELANACVAYLQESANLEKSRRVRLREMDEISNADAAFFMKHPFLEYAIINWTYHAARGSLEKTKYDVAFFKEKSTRRRLWWKSYWISLRQNIAWKWTGKWTTPGNFSLLHLASFFDIVPLANYVEERGYLDRLLEAEDHQGMKPINWATEKSSSTMVQFLLERGAFDNEALFQAARTGQVQIIRMLLENKRKSMRSSHVQSSMSSPASPSSPLQSFRKVTLRSISDFSKQMDKTDESKPIAMSPADRGYGKAKSETPLHIAAACGHDEAVEALLEGGEILYTTTDGGWTALHNAAWFGRGSVVERLIVAGANPNAKTKDQLTPLHCAVKNSQAPSVGLLLTTKTVEIEVEDQFGITPFQMACKCRNIPIMDLLHDRVDIERRMRIGWTPLMLAVVEGFFDVVQWLLKHHVEVNAKWLHEHEDAGDSIELNALDLAKSYHRQEITELLKNYGAIENKSLTSKSTNNLPLPGVLEETYDLPESQHFAMLQLERTETGDSVLVSDHNGSSEDEQSSAAGSDMSDDDEIRSRTQSASSIEEDAGPRRHSSFALRGLGIREEIEDNFETEGGLESDEKSRLRNEVDLGTSADGQLVVDHSMMTNGASSLANASNGEVNVDVSDPGGVHIPALDAEVDAAPPAIVSDDQLHLRSSSTEDFGDGAVDQQRMESTSITAESIDRNGAVDARIATGVIIGTRERNAGLVSEPQTYGNVNCENDKTLDEDEVARAMPLISNDQEGTDVPLFDPAGERRKGSGPKSPNVMVDVFNRIGWKKSGSSAGLENNSLTQSSSIERQRSANNTHPAPDVGNEPAVGSKVSKSDSKLFARFKDKRTFSWKKENGNGTTGSVSPGPDENSAMAILPSVPSKTSPDASTASATSETL